MPPLPPKPINRASKTDVENAANEALPGYGYDRYRRYPASRRESWIEHAFVRLRGFLANPEWVFYVDGPSKAPAILGCRISRWDMDHFGFGMAFLSVFICGKAAEANRALSANLDACLTDLRSGGIRFVCSRVCGDDLAVIQALEDRGFRYYETEVSPVVRAGKRDDTLDPEVRLMTVDDLEDVKRIAACSQYASGHYQSDLGFDQQKVSTMYVKWVETSFRNAEPIAVIAPAGIVRGYFIFREDRDLSNALGISYGTMRSLALDPEARGIRLGRRLFRACLTLLQKRGAEYVDSTYTVGNHISAALHTDEGFHSAYQEVTLHLWLTSVFSGREQR